MGTYPRSPHNATHSPQIVPHTPHLATQMHLATGRAAPAAFVQRIVR